jgi:arsenate reductase
MSAPMKKRVLFLCTRNSARSQMAEGLLRHFKGDRYEAYSAGTRPAELHPTAVKVMAEIGIDISAHWSKGLDAFEGARAECPFFPGAAAMAHRGFRDPSGFEGTEAEKVQMFRIIRDEIKDWIMAYFADDKALGKLGVILA